MFTLLSSSNGFYGVILPILTLINSYTAPFLMIVGSLGAIQCIFLGVRYAKAQEPEELAQAKKNLQEFLIGFILIFVLIVAMRAGMPSLCAWMEENTRVTIY